MCRSMYSYVVPRPPRPPRPEDAPDRMATPSAPPGGYIPPARDGVTVPAHPYFSKKSRKWCRGIRRPSGSRAAEIGPGVVEEGAGGHEGRRARASGRGGVSAVVDRGARGA